MDIKFIESSMLALMAMIAAGMLTAKLRRFFERKPGEPWPLFFQRAQEERQKGLEARQTMFGTRPTTVRADLLTFGLLGVLAYSAVSPPIMSVLSLYLLIGLVVSRRTANAAKTAEHTRLSISDRLWFRLYFAWTWIFNIFRTPT